MINKFILLAHQNKWRRNGSWAVDSTLSFPYKNMLLSIRKGEVDYAGLDSAFCSRAGNVLQISTFHLFYQYHHPSHEIWWLLIVLHGSVCTASLCPASTVCSLHPAGRQACSRWLSDTALFGMLMRKQKQQLLRCSVSLFIPKHETAD